MSKCVKLFVPIFLVLLLISTYIVPFIKTSENISNDVFRLHILANSDEKIDQDLKLKVRDEVLKCGESLFINCKSLDEIIDVSKKNINYFEKIANDCIKNNGFDYKAKVYVDNEYFNTRVYNSITLPSGFYNALKIELGQAQGHNWWCVMFPAICLPSVSENEIYNVLDDDEIDLVKSNSKYEFRFKIVEIYEKIKSIIFKK